MSTMRLSLILIMVCLAMTWVNSQSRWIDWLAGLLFLCVLALLLVTP